MVWLCPAVKVTGRVKPLVVVSVALTVTCEMVTLEVPLLVSVTLCELELPALTFPKLRLVGLAVNVKLAATPVPVKDIVAGEPGALLVTVTVPGRFPAVVGANSALNAAFAPAASVVGVARPLMLYPAPLTANWEMVRDAAPVFVSVKVCDLVCPSVTLPNAKLDGLMLNPG
jgi:hypothetical protein